MKTTFKKFKEKILARADSKGACIDEFERGQKANRKQALKVIKDNMAWLYQGKVITIDDLKFFSSKELLDAGIYINKKVEVKDAYVVALGNSTVEAWDNSTVKAWDNSTVEALGNSTVEALGNSTVKAWDNSTVKAWDNSTVEAWDNSTVKAWDNSTVKAWDNSTVKAWDNSTVEALGNSYINSKNGKHEISDYAICRDYYKDIIYIKKGKFKIVKI